MELMGRFGLLAIAAAAAFAAFALARNAGWDAGYNARDIEVRTLAEAHGRVVAAAAEEIAAIRADAAGRIRAAQVRGAAAQEEVIRYVEADPDFAALRRPGELERLRRKQLEDIAAAAAHRDMR